jgi:hypothetical protein
MKKIFFLETRTAFLIFMASSFTTPLVAFELVQSTLFSKPRQSSTYHSVVKHLVDQGLENEAAETKVSTLLHPGAEQTLLYLSQHPLLKISQEELHTALAKRALYEKPLHIHDYDALTGLVQSIKGMRLSQQQRQAIRDVMRAGDLHLV